MLNEYNKIGMFGLAGYKNSTQDWGATGGGGYYGGTSVEYTGASGGGSSFISGHEGCDAIFSNSSEKDVIHSHQPNHYSGFVFFSTEMKGGKEIMPQPRGSKEVGYTGNGVVKITPLLMLGDYKTCMKRKASLSFVLFIVFIITKV